MNSRGWPGPDDDRSDDLRALARRARGLLPQLHPGLTMDSDYYRYLRDATGPGPAR